MRLETRQIYSLRDSLSGASERALLKNTELNLNNLNNLRNKASDLSQIIFYYWRDIQMKTFGERFRFFEISMFGRLNTDFALERLSK